MEHSVIKASVRSGKGRKPCRRLRRQGQVPAIIYGHRQEPQPISMPTHDVELHLARGAHVLEVELSGQKAQYLVKEVQYDTFGSEMLHLDLARVSLDEAVQVTVPLEFRGTPKGAQAGGYLDQVLVDLDVECLVTQIPELIKVPVGDLDVGQGVHARDVPLPEGVKLVTDPDGLVCQVRAKVTATAEEEEAPKAAAPAGQPEVIARAKEEGQSESTGQS